MRFFRSQRVEALIQEELSQILMREMDFSSSFVTVTDVDVDKKMERAKVRLSVIPSTSGSFVLRAVNERVGSFQHLLMKKINIKPMPRIIFEIDHGSENAASVEKALISDPQSFSDEMP